MVDFRYHKAEFSNLLFASMQKVIHHRVVDSNTLATLLGRGIGVPTKRYMEKIFNEEIIDNSSSGTIRMRIPQTTND